MNKNDWYKKWFNTQDYLNLYKHRNSIDASRLIRLLSRNIQLPRGSKALDLACGNGRHSYLLVRKGYQTLGIDLSPHMIKAARVTYKSLLGKRLKFEIGDMRRIVHKNEFDLVVNLFSSFGYFSKRSENEKVIKSIAGALKTGGYFFFDFFNSMYIKNNIVPFSYKKRKNEVIFQMRNIKGGFSNKTILIFDANSNFRQFNEKVMLFNDSDFTKIFKMNKLKIIKKFGNYYGKPFEKSTSERLIILAQKV